MHKLFTEYVVDLPPLIEAGWLRLPGYDRQPEVKSIKLLAAQDNYTMVYLFEKPYPLVVCQTLKTFADQLPGFVRANKGTLINPTVIKKAIVFNAKQMNLELTTGECILVSRRRITTVLAQLSLPPIRSTAKSTGTTPLLKFVGLLLPMHVGRLYEGRMI